MLLTAVSLIIVIAFKTPLNGPSRIAKPKLSLSASVAINIILRVLSSIVFIFISFTIGGD